MRYRCSQQRMAKTAAGPQDPFGIPIHACHCEHTVQSKYSLISNSAKPYPEMKKSPRKRGDMGYNSHKILPTRMPSPDPRASIELWNPVTQTPMTMLRQHRRACVCQGVHTSPQLSRPVAHVPSARRTTSANVWQCSAQILKLSNTPSYTETTPPGVNMILCCTAEIHFTQLICVTILFVATSCTTSHHMGVTELRRSTQAHVYHATPH